jgi:hypothetical protein
LADLSLTATDWLFVLVLGGAAGALGQMVRTVVGLKKAADSRAASASEGAFDSQRLVLSLVIGATAGAIAALTTNVDPTERIPLQAVLGLAAAGYAGADFIEGAMRRALPSVTAPAVPAAPAASTAPAPVEPTPPRSPDDPAGDDFLG